MSSQITSNVFRDDANVLAGVHSSVLGCSFQTDSRVVVEPQLSSLGTRLILDSLGRGFVVFRYTARIGSEHVSVAAL